MPVAEKIVTHKPEGEFRTCSVCGYDQGFHVSFQEKGSKAAHIVLICPQCGARFDIGWDISISK